MTAFPADAGSPSAGTCTCGRPTQHTGSCPAHQRDACALCAAGAVPITEHHGTAPWRPAVPSPEDTLEHKPWCALRAIGGCDCGARSTPPAVRTGEDDEADHFMNVDYTPRPERVGWPHSHTARPLVSGMANRDDVARGRVARWLSSYDAEDRSWIWESGGAIAESYRLAYFADADQLLALLGGDQDSAK